MGERETDRQTERARERVQGVRSLRGGVRGHLRITVPGYRHNEKKNLRPAANCNVGSALSLLIERPVCVCDLLLRVKNKKTRRKQQGSLVGFWDKANIQSAVEIALGAR